MKQYILVIFILIFCINHNIISKDIINIAIGEYPPYVSKNLKHYGVAAHIVKEAFALEKVDVEYGFFPWSRTYNYVKSGEWHGTIPWVYSDERAKYFHYTDSIIEGQAVFYHLKKNSFDWKTLKDLENITIGGVLEASYSWFDEAVDKGINLKMERVALDKMNFDKLLNERFLVTTMDIYLGQHILNASFNEEQRNLITYHPKIITKYVYHLLLSKNNNESLKFRRLFNKGMKKLKSSGKYDQFIKASQNGEYIIK